MNIIRKSLLDWLPVFALAPLVFAQSPYEGKLIKGNGVWKDTVWIVLHGARHHISNPAVFNACGFNWNNIQTLPDDVVTSIPEKVRIMSKEEYELLRDNVDYQALVFIANSSTPGGSSSVTVCRNDGTCASRGTQPNAPPDTVAYLASQAAAEVKLSTSWNESRLLIAGPRTRVTCSNCQINDADNPAAYY